MTDETRKPSTAELVRKHDEVLFGSENEGGVSLVGRFLRAEKLLWVNTVLLGGQYAGALKLIPISPPPALSWVVDLLSRNL